MVCLKQITPEKEALISAQGLSPWGEMADEILTVNDNLNISINSIVLTDLFHFI